MTLGNRFAIVRIRLLNLDVPIRATLNHEVCVLLREFLLIRNLLTLALLTDIFISLRLHNHVDVLRLSIIDKATMLGQLGGLLARGTTLAPVLGRDGAL